MGKGVRTASKRADGRSSGARALSPPPPRFIRFSGPAEPDEFSVFAVRCSRGAVVVHDTRYRLLRESQNITHAHTHAHARIHCHTGRALCPASSHRHRRRGITAGRDAAGPLRTSYDDERACIFNYF